MYNYKMDNLRANAASRKACNVTPHIIQVLEEHSERLLKLEALMKISQQQVIEAPPPAPVEPAPVEPAPVEPEPQQTFEEEVAEIENKIETNTTIVEPTIVNPLIAELTNKISDLANQNIVIGDEIHTLEMLEEEDPFDVSECDDISVCTDDCRELIQQNAELIKVGSWKVENEVCNDCIKTRAKAFQKEKKAREKQRATELKEIKKKQKELIKLEQKQLAIKLKNIKKNRPEDYGLDTRKQDEMRAELQRIATEYQKKGTTGGSTFNIQMYV